MKMWLTSRNDVCVCATCERGGAEHCSFVRRGERSLGSVVGCRRQLWNVAMHSPEEVEPGGVIDCARR